MRDLRARFGVCSKTIERWTESGILPQPMRINKLRYWDLGEIEAMERDRMAALSSSEAA
jgi:hypothetical protein